MWSYNYTNALMHHGIKGMKWGQRRYRNKDGSLTPAGKKRYSDSDGSRKVSAKSKKQQAREDIKKMSDAELRQKLNRLQMEQQYSKLSGADVNRGKMYVEKVIKVGTTVAAVTTTAITIYNNAGKIADIAKKVGKK